jgi:hypothetical protein
MKELLENMLVYFEKKQACSCQCHNCVEAREWILMIKKELENDANPQN